MVLKVYQKYLIKEFIFISLRITFVFLVLGLIMGLLEELNFFSDYDVEYFYPIYLVLFNPLFLNVFNSPLSNNLINKN